MLDFLLERKFNEEELFVKLRHYHWFCLSSSGSFDKIVKISLVCNSFVFRVSAVEMFCPALEKAYQSAFRDEQNEVVMVGLLTFLCCFLLHLCIKPSKSAGR